MTDESLFTAALDHADRAAFLTTACPNDPARRQRVEALLAAHDAAGSFLGSPAVAAADADHTRSVADPNDTRPQEPGSSADEPLTFLMPPTKPGSLGRLAHYEILEQLGRGGFGVVLKAFDDRLQRVVAIKVMAPQLATSGPARARFVREGRSGAAVRDTHVVNIHAVSGDDEPVPFLVMEFVSGQTLQQKLDKSGPLPAKEILRIGVQIARGLAAAHATGLIHRDIKPANILLENGVERVKISDFGLARAADDASISQSGVVAGTPMYMSPEQARGDVLDARSDLFSLGSVLYTLCTGRPPFRADSVVAVLKRVVDEEPRPVREVNPEVPQWLADVVAKLHAKDPAQRFQSAKEVAELLAGYQQELEEKGNVSHQELAIKPARVGWWPWVRAALQFAGISALAVVVFFKPTIFRYVNDVGRVTVTTQRGVTAVHIRQNGHVVKSIEYSPLSHPTTFELPAGVYQVETEFDPDCVVENILVDYEYSLSFISTFQEGHACEFTIPRGHKVTLTTVVSAKRATPNEPAIARSNPAHVQALRDKVAAREKDLDALLAKFKDGTVTAGPGFAAASELTEAKIELAEAQGDTAAVVAYLTRLVKDRQSEQEYARLRVEAKIEPPESVAKFDALVADAKARLAKAGEIVRSSAPADADRLQGRWRLVAAERDGKPVPAAELQADDWIEFTGDRQTTFHNRTGLGRFTLNASANPPELDFVYPDYPTVRMLYRFDGDRLVLAQALPGKPRPTGFTTTSKTTFAVVTYVRDAAPPAAVAPSPAVAPFDAAKAKDYQVAWATHLGVPVEHVNSIGMKFRLIPPGEYLFGASKEEVDAAFRAIDPTIQAGYKIAFESQSPTQRVRLTKPFYLGVHEVRQQDFEKILGRNPSYHSPNCPNPSRINGLNTRLLPVETVTWYDALEFCSKLSQSEQLKPKYSVRGNTLTLLDGDGYELPTEFQWEYAGRAGTETWYSSGDTEADLRKVGWYYNNSKQNLHQSGQLAANAFGLYDMHGNVSEWTKSVFTGAREGWQGAVIVDPTGPELSRGVISLRGGNWDESSSFSRSASRTGFGAYASNYKIGFRVSLSVDAVRAGIKQASRPPTVPSFDAEKGKKEPPAKPVTWLDAMRAVAWPNGSTVTVGFIDPTPPANAVAAVRGAFTEWAKYANLSFAFTDSPEKAMIRVSFELHRLPEKHRAAGAAGHGLSVHGSGASDSTLLGDTTLFLNVAAQYQPTLAGEALHVVGHALGLIGEETRFPPPWEKPVFAPTGGPLDRFDPDSVMVHPIPPNDRRLKQNFVLSDQDKRLIAALYPGRWTPPADRPMQTVGMITWGRLVDPSKSVKVETKMTQAAFSVPGGKPLNLNPEPGFNLDAPRVVWDAAGEFAYQVTVHGFPHPKKGTSERGPGAASYLGAGLVVWVDEKNFVRFERAGNGEVEDGRPCLHAEGFIDGKKVFDERDWADGPATELRVERRGGAIVLRRLSVDAKRWEDWKTFDRLKLPANVTVGMVAVNSTTGLFEPVFDNLMVGVDPPRR